MGLKSCAFDQALLPLHSSAEQGVISFKNLSFLDRGKERKETEK